METVYCEAYPTANGYRGRVYKYDSTGNKTIVIKNDPTEFLTKEEAIDCLVEWCDENNIHCEIDFG